MQPEAFGVFVAGAAHADEPIKMEHIRIGNRVNVSLRLAFILPSLSFLIEQEPVAMRAAPGAAVTHRSPGLRKFGDNRHEVAICVPFLIEFGWSGSAPVLTNPKHSFPHLGGGSVEMSAKTARIECRAEAFVSTWDNSNLGR